MSRKPKINIDKLVKEQAAAEKNEYSNIRVSASHVKLLIKGQHDQGENIEIWKKRKTGTYELRWAGHLPIKSTKRKRCDLDHYHEVTEKQHWVWNYCEISKKDAQKIIEFFGGNVR